MRRKGYWKLNTSLLSNIEYVQMINRVINEAKEALNQKPIKTLWEHLKLDIAKHTKSFARNHSDERNYVIGQLTEKVSEMEENIYKMSDQELYLYSETKAELEDLTNEKAKGLIFRSRARWYEQGEKGTCYFANLEKKCYNARVCDVLLSGDGKEVTEESELLNLQQSFYADLFTSNPNVKFDIRNETGIRIYSRDIGAQEIEFTKQEVIAAINDMANDKTPGKDGIPVEFYKTFINQLIDLLLILIQECYSSGEMHESAMLGVINLIPKADKDTRHLKNLCPLTLLNCDYKIVDKMVAKRIQPALQQIIHQDQQGFMTGRRISTNIRRVIDLMNLCNKQNIEGLLLQIDFAKCFDKLEFSGILGSLHFFCFSSYICNWVRILYTNFKAMVQSNGNFSDKISIS